jgi:hypothetical protein
MLLVAKLNEVSGWLDCVGVLRIAGTEWQNEYMKLRISTAVWAVFTLLGIGSIVIPRYAIPYVGWPLLVLGVLVGIWTLAGWLHFRVLTRLMRDRIQVTFMGADFGAIGMSGAYVDFCFNIHSCLPGYVMVTGEKKGDLWNPCVEAWRSSWEVEPAYRSVIKPESDVEFKIRWSVPQGYNSPMSEFAFAASDEPAEQDLSFEDMKIELKAGFIGFEREIGWLPLSKGAVRVPVPDHPVFKKVRRACLMAKE